MEDIKIDFSKRVMLDKTGNPIRTIDCSNPTGPLLWMNGWGQYVKEDPRIDKIIDKNV